MRLGKRLLCPVLLVGLCFGSAAGAETTKLMFSFDTEDFTNPRSADAILRVVELFESEGLVGHFQVVGQLARQLENWGRQDVIKALSRHLIGTHTLNHSIHPNILELSDGEDYTAAYERVMAQESECVATLKRVFKTDRIWSSSPSGNCESYVADRVYADMGIDYGVGPHYTTMDGDDIWFAGQRRIAYIYSWEDFFYCGESFDRSEKKLLDRLAKSRVGMVFLHPNFAYSKVFWDRLNYNGGNHARWGEWKLSAPRDKKTVDAYFDWIRQMLRAIKRDPRFELTTIPELDRARKPRRPIRRGDLAQIRESLRKDFTTIREPASWCVSDVFVAVVKMLRGENEYLPGVAYGFLDRPVGVTNRVVVSRVDVAKAAEVMDVGGFLPASIRVGDYFIGPADFLFAGLDILVDGGETALVVPKEQLGRFKGTPLEPLEHRVRVKIPGDPRSGWMHTAAFRDEFTAPRLRWQLWTFRYEE